MPEPCYLEFQASDPGRLESLERVVAALVQAKKADKWQDDEFWLDFFDATARSSFWWPTDAERQEWERRWFATPVDQRFTDPALAVPWDFGSMLDAFRQGDYRLCGLRRLAQKTARIEYEPFGDPYGGNGCMKALVEAFGCRVTRERA